MNKPWKVILTFLGVFLAGAVFGGFLSLRLLPHFRPAPPAQPGQPRGPGGEQFSLQVFRRLSDRLELTAEQKEKLRPIIKETDTEMRRLRTANFRESMALAEQMHEKIAAILTPAQLAKLEAMRKEMRERWTKDRQQRWGDRPPPSGERPALVRPEVQPEPPESAPSP